MSVIMNFAIFPIDKGDHIGDYVSQIVAYIRDSGLTYQFTPMGTIVEAETVSELLKIVDDSYKILDPISDRIYCVMNIDSNRNKTNLLKNKTASIESRIGIVSK